MKKVLFLLCCLPLLQLACKRDECEKTRYFDVNGIRIIPMAIPANSNGLTNPITLYKYDSIPFEQFYLDGYLQASYHARTNSRGFSFISSATAADCAAPGYDGSQESVANVQLVALGNYSSQYQPGDTLKNAILINNNLQALYISENSQKIKDQYFTIKLTERPNRKYFQAFKVIFQLTNGETYVVNTPPIKLY